MILEVSNSLEFTPEWNGNRTDDNPIKVFHKAPTMALYEQLIPKPKLEMQLGKTGEMEGATSTVSIDNKKIVRAMVTSISNLEFKIDGKSFSIKSADELFGDVPAFISSLVDEIGVYLQGLLSSKDAEIKAKN